MGIIVSQVPELLDSDRCTLFFVDREKEQLIVTKGASKGRAKSLAGWIFGQSNAPELPFPKDRNELRLSMHNGIAGHVAMSGETTNIVDAHQDPRFVRFPPPPRLAASVGESGGTWDCCFVHVCDTLIPPFSLHVHGVRSLFVSLFFGFFRPCPISPFFF